MTVSVCPLEFKIKQPSKKYVRTPRKRKFVEKTDYIKMHHYDKMSKFKSIDEFNNHFEQIMLLHKKKFSKSEYKALNKLRKFAYSQEFSECVGVCWANIATIVAATFSDGSHIDGISRPTFERMLTTAQELNIVTIIPQKRENGWTKHNAYIFNRLEEVKPENYVLEKVRKREAAKLAKKMNNQESESEKNENNGSTQSHKKDFEIVGIVSENDTIDVLVNVKKEGAISINLLELPFIKELYTYYKRQQAKPATQNDSEKLIKLDDRDITNYGKFKKYASSFFEQKVISRIYGIWLAQINNLINKPTFELLNRAVQATIVGYKSKLNTSDPVRDVPSYFNGVLSKIIDKWCEEQCYIAFQEYDNACSETQNDASLSVEKDYKHTENDLKLRNDYLQRKFEELEYSKLKERDIARYYRRYSRLKKYENRLFEYSTALTNYLIRRELYNVS